MAEYRDDRSGGDRWRDREQRDIGGDHSRRGREGGGWDQGRREATGWGPGGSSDGGDRDWHRGQSDDDRGFLDRAGDELRSWFGDDDAQRRREEDERRWARERGMTGSRGNDGGRLRDSEDHSSGGAGGFGRGWGNQAGESWNRERPGRPGWFTDSVGGERGHRQGGSAGRQDDGRDEGDRYGGSMDYGARGGGRSRYGAHADRTAPGGGMGSLPGSAREEANLREQRNYGEAPMRRGGQDYGQRDDGMPSHGHSEHAHDPHYAEWRRRQIEQLDRDYDEYRREHQTKFESEFGGWRSKRQGQRQMLNMVQQHMEVIGSDGAALGTVDKVVADRIILTKGDATSDGFHHSLPCGWIENVDQRVTLNRTAEDARSEWRNEQRNRALFERPAQGADGPHVLNRSFAGTYETDEVSEPTGAAAGGMTAAGRDTTSDAASGSDRDRTDRTDRTDPKA